MVGSPLSLALQASSHLGVLQSCIADQDIKAFEACLSQIEKEQTLVILAEAIDGEVNGEGYFFEALCYSIILFANPAFLKHLFEEKNLVIDIKSLYLFSINYSKIDFIKYFFEQHENSLSGLKKIIQGYGMAVAFENEALQRLLTDRLHKIIDDNEIDNIQQEVIALKQKLQEKYQKIAQTDCEIFSKKIKEISENINLLAETLGQYSFTNNSVNQFMNRILEINKQLNSFGQSATLHELNLQLLLRQFKKIIELEASIESFDPVPTIEIIHTLLTRLRPSYLITSLSSELIQKLDLAEDFIPTLQYLIEDNVEKFSRSLRALESKGVSLGYLDTLLFNIYQQDKLFSTSLLSDSVSHCNLNIYQYLMQQDDIKKDQKILESLLPLVAYFNQQEIMQQLLQIKALKINSNLLLSAYSLSLIHDDEKIAQSIQQIITELNPLRGKKIERLQQEYKTLSKIRNAKTLSKVKELILNYLNKSRLLSDTFQKHDYVDAKLSSAFEKLNFVFQIMNDLSDKYFKFPELPLCIAQLLILKIKVMISQNPMLKNKFKDEVKIVQQLLGELDPVYIKNFVSLELDIEQLPERIKEDYYRQNREDAILKPTSREHALYHAVKGNYSVNYQMYCNQYTKEKAETTQEKGPINLKELECYPILKDLENYLICEFEKANLVQEYDPRWSKEEHERYYINPFHTAWRYIFARPNPWLASNATWSKYGASIINPEDLKLIAYFWLAASDDKTVGIDDFSIKERKAYFAQELACFGREYNIEASTNLDNLQGDNPSCNRGIRKRGYQLLIGHPLIYVARELNVETVMDRFRQRYIAENDLEQTIFSKLNALSKKNLAGLHKYLEDWIVSFGKDQDRSVQAVSLLYFDEDLLTKREQFISNLIEEFGKKTLLNTAVHYQTNKYQNYIELIDALFKEPLHFFVTQIYDKVSSLLSQTHSVEEHEYTTNPPLVPSFETFIKIEENQRSKDKQPNAFCHGEYQHSGYDHRA